LGEQGVPLSHGAAQAALFPPHPGDACGGNRRSLQARSDKRLSARRRQREFASRETHRTVTEAGEHRLCMAENGCGGTKHDRETVVGGEDEGVCTNEINGHKYARKARSIPRSRDLGRGYGHVCD